MRQRAFFEASSAQAKKPKAREKAPAPTAPLTESLNFAVWAEEFRILNYYRRWIVKGDDAMRSLPLIREALAKYGQPKLTKAIDCYAKDCGGTEARFRRRPHTFFRPDIIEQYIPEGTGEPAPSKESSVEQLRKRIEEAKGSP